MKKQRTIRMEAWVGVLALIVATSVVGTALAAPAPVAAQAVVGDWNGALSTGGGSLRVVIHVAQDKDGKLTATMDSREGRHGNSDQLHHLQGTGIAL